MKLKYDNQKFEELVRQYERCGDQGIRGFIDRLPIFAEVDNNYEPHQLEKFCERVHFCREADKDLHRHFGSRLEKLKAILGTRLEAFGVLHLLLANTTVFQAAVEFAKIHTQPGASADALFRGISRGVAEVALSMKLGEEREIVGIQFKGVPPPDPNRTEH